MVEIVLRSAVERDVEALAVVQSMPWTEGFKDQLPAAVFERRAGLDACREGWSRRFALAHLQRNGFTEAVLWVMTDLERARRFYDHFGWRIDGSWVMHTREGSDVPFTRLRRAVGGPTP